METEFNDRAGKVIHFGDLVQYRLSTISQGPSILRVVKGKRNKVLMVDPRAESYKGGIGIGKQIEKYISIIDTSGREDYLNKVL